MTTTSPAPGTTNEFDPDAVNTDALNTDAVDTDAVDTDAVVQARELLDQLNAEAAAHSVWVRTQANAPAQRPWFTEPTATRGSLSSGPVAGGQLKAVPHLWRWTDYEPFLRRLSTFAATAEVSPILFADRQSILLRNPGLNQRLQVTATIRCAISIYNPGDVAPTHVHSPNASRTILTERGGYTNIEGEVCAARRGDVILTPNGTWHDHGNDDAEPIIWMDLLDWPLMEYLDCAWVDQNPTGGTIKRGAQVQTADRMADYSSALYGTGGLVPAFTSPQRGFGIDPSPMFRYRGSDVRAMLAGLRDEDGDPHEGISLAFVNPVTGAPVFRTHHYGAQLLRPGERTELKRETASTFCIVMEGTGRTQIGDQEFEWSPNDAFVMPNFLWRRHINTGPGDAVLYTVSDAALLRNIGQYRAQGRTGGTVVELA
jgi:gentisate 1,2-dioxygenase